MQDSHNIIVWPVAFFVVALAITVMVRDFIYRVLEQSAQTAPAGRTLKSLSRE